ncbi:hypothetical protein [Burkholderia sp. Ac-20379]|uniref:hypothetical protein n=1 Tax=Burkholderia sp. Ac-20379 TaxID=2703900 RepID=UPI001980C76B|nr:hypothetical protein [Burkholderia sp. Ac-20379]MBN3726565.1 hypothetical protein [Burkholderia sp. Ac-20379]
MMFPGVDAIHVNTRIGAKKNRSDTESKSDCIDRATYRFDAWAHSRRARRCASAVRDARPRRALNALPARLARRIAHRFEVPRSR